MCQKTKAKKSITIAITIALILFTYSTWEEYQIRNKDSLRQVVIENVERFWNCRKPQNGYKVYQCPECGAKKYVPFTCKSRLCTSCGTKAANEWADQIYHKLLKKELPKGTETNVFIDQLFKDYPNGFVVNGKRRFEKREGWSMARYIGRYIKHPPIAESRIIAYDGKQVTFWYRDSETDQKISVTMDKF